MMRIEITCCASKFSAKWNPNKLLDLVFDRLYNCDKPFSPFPMQPFSHTIFFKTGFNK